MSSRSRFAVVWLASSMLATTGLGQNVQPVRGQAAEQQNQDESHCSAWATQQSGFDPAKPWLAPQASLDSTSGSSTRIRGATASAVAGGMTRRDAGDAAVAGAIIVATTQPATGGSTGANTRREIQAAGSGADGTTRALPQAVGVQIHQGATSATGSGDAGSASAAGSAAAAAILGRDAGSVIAAGAVAAPTARRDANPMIILQEEPPDSQPRPSGHSLFRRARMECLEALGYTAK